MGLRLAVALLLLYSSLGVVAQNSPALSPDIDSDHDGLSDALENTLIQQFQPHFMVSREDCSVRPARFVEGTSKPIPATDNGTIYAQAFPRNGKTDEVELHFYHLWRRDCGQMGHDLDTEHISVLLRHRADE